MGNDTNSLCPAAITTQSHTKTIFQFNSILFICIALSHIHRHLRALKQINVKKEEPAEDQQGPESKQDATAPRKNSPVGRHLGQIQTSSTQHAFQSGIDR